MTLRRPSSVPPHGLLPGARRLDFVTGSPTLTSLARAGGCAAKYPAARLEKLLAGLVPAEAADLLVGLDPADDAAVYRLDDERALVFTVDFFPPVVDDPRAFGAIAATNALNDVFAMGGVPLLALSITAFPEELPTEMLGEILAGADEAVRAAGAILAGGHTIRDDEPKYGLAVVGTVHPDGIWPKSGAQARGRAVPDEAARHRARAAGPARGPRAGRRARGCGGRDAHLNRDAADALRPFAPNAVTDVTGFGLLGHAYEMASRSGVRIELDAAALPALPGALELAEAGVRTGGDRRNRDYAGPHVESSGGGRRRGARLRPADRRRAARLAARRQGRRARRPHSPTAGSSSTGSVAFETGSGVDAPVETIGAGGRTSTTDGRVRAAPVSPARFVQLAAVDGLHAAGSSSRPGPSSG